MWHTETALITRLRGPGELQGVLIAESAPTTHSAISIRWEYLLCQHHQLWFSKFLFSAHVCPVLLYELVNSSVRLEQFEASEALSCSSLHLCISDSAGSCYLPQFILIQCQAGRHFFKINSVLNFFIFLCLKDFFLLILFTFSLLILIIDTYALLCHSSLKHLYLVYPKLLLHFIWP